MKSKVVSDHITTRSTRSKKASIIEETDIEKNQFVKPNEMKGGLRKTKTRKGKSVVTRKGKSVVTKTTSNYYVRTRSCPRPLYDSLRLLSNSQKNALVDMGFGFLIGMNIRFVPLTLSKYIVENFNQSLMCIKLRDDSIEITPELVKEVLGIPLGGQGLVKRSNKELKDRWKAQFNRPIIPKRVAEMIEKTDEAGIMFKLNFFVVFYNAMCASHKDGSANIDILDYISEDVEIRNLDWCNFVFDCLKHAKKGKFYFCGSVTLLMLIYLNCTKCDEVNVMRSRPAITSWTSDLMKDREEFEIENGGFGNLELLPLDDEVFKEQSSQKDLQFVKDKIEANLFFLSDEKNKLQKFVTDSMLMFPDDIKLKELKGIFDDLFCQKKVYDPECSHDLNVIGTSAADANREDQGIAADVDDPTVKERNHDDQGVEETASIFPDDNDAVKCSNATHIDHPTVEKKNDVSEKELGKMGDFEKQNDEGLEAVKTQRKRRGQPKKLGRRGRPKKRGMDNENEVVEIPKHVEGTAGDADFVDEETVAADFNTDKDDGKKDDADKQNEDVEAMEIVDYIKTSGWPTKRGRDNEIDDVEALKRKCAGQPTTIAAETASANRSQISSVAQPSQTPQPSQAIVAQASQTTKASQIRQCSQTSILHASPIRMTKNTARRTAIWTG